MEVREVTKLLWHDMTSSSDDFTSYRLSIKLIPTTSATYRVTNETPDSYPEGDTLSKSIHEGRPTTTKPTFVALPNLTSHSTFHECSRGIFYQLQYSPHGHLTKLGVITLYFLRLERKIISPLTFIIRWNTTTGIHTDEVDLLDFKEDNDLPSWYPTFQLPYQIDKKLTCTGVHVYVEIIYIDLSPDPNIFAPYVYCDPSDDLIRCLYGISSKENYISDH